MCDLMTEPCPCFYLYEMIWDYKNIYNCKKIIDFFDKKVIII